MNPSILLNEAMQKISAASKDFQTSEISRLNALAQRIAEIQAKQQGLEQELSSIAKELNWESSERPITAETFSSGAYASTTATPTQSRARPLLGPIAVTIDWTAVGKIHPKQTICERKASDTLRIFFETIHDQFGIETLARLVAVRANRAPLLSRQPQVDFLNSKQGVCYQHQPVGSTGWYVLTHSSTSEKLAIIKQVGRALRFPAGAVYVQEVDIKHEIEALLN